MSKMSKKIIALLLAVMMASSTCSVGMAAQEQVEGIRDNRFHFHRRGCHSNI
ncbi:hypothetical protein [Anaeromassilibacillus sp. SJQ-1]|uniref:hypothetical protein n=1 Tax=Anaeromassilibacillus sp. SJQ-1 TaxID=3375419 RepID=UPI003988B18F